MTKQQQTTTVVLVSITIVSVLIIVVTTTRSVLSSLLVTTKTDSSNTDNDSPSNNNNNTNNKDDNTIDHPNNVDDDTDTRQKSTKDSSKNKIVNDPTYNNNNNNTNNNNQAMKSISSTIRLPSHLQRDIYKEQRRKIMTPLLTMKKPLYDNIILLDPDGNTLSLISYKRAKRYVTKNVAQWITVQPPTDSSTCSIKVESDEQITATTKSSSSSIQSTTTTPATLQLKFYPQIKKNPIPNKTIIIQQDSTSSNNNDIINDNNNTDRIKPQSNNETNTTKNSQDGELASSSSATMIDRILYNQSLKINQCVVCGNQSKGYMRHYIVPYMYRTKFPKRYKVHLAHDIVLLCPQCSLYCKQTTNRFYTDEIEYPLRKQYWTEQVDNEETTGSSVRLNTILKDLHIKEQYQYTTSRYKLIETLIDISTKAELVNQMKQKVRTAALALLRRKHQLPPDRITEYENIIMSYYHRTNTNNSYNNSRATSRHDTDDNTDTVNINNTTSELTKTQNKESSYNPTISDNSGINKNDASIDQNISSNFADAGTTTNNIDDGSFGEPQGVDCCTIQHNSITTPPYQTKAYLQELSLLKYQDPNPFYRSGVDLVIDSLLLLSPLDSCDPETSRTLSSTTTTTTISSTTTTTMNQRIDHFVKLFRRHFIDTMNPQYLPIGWSIDAPTVCVDSS